MIISVLLMIKKNKFKNLIIKISSLWNKFVSDDSNTFQCGHDGETLFLNHFDMIGNNFAYFCRHCQFMLFSHGIIIIRFINEDK